MRTFLRNVSPGRKLYTMRTLHSVWNVSILQHTGRMPDGMRCCEANVFYRAIIPNGIHIDIHKITRHLMFVTLFKLQPT